MPLMVDSNEAEVSGEVIWTQSVFWSAFSPNSGRICTDLGQSLPNCSKWIQITPKFFIRMVPNDSDSLQFFPNATKWFHAQNISKSVCPITYTWLTQAKVSVDVRWVVMFGECWCSVKLLRSQMGCICKTSRDIRGNRQLRRILDANFGKVSNCLGVL